jgi:hypothetical protein
VLARVIVNHGAKKYSDEPWVVFEGLKEDTLRYGMRLILELLPEGYKPWGTPWVCYVGGKCPYYSYNAISADHKRLQYYFVGCILHEMGHALWGMGHTKDKTIMDVVDNWQQTFGERSREQAANWLEYNCCVFARE